MNNYNQKMTDVGEILIITSIIIIIGLSIVFCCFNGDPCDFCGGNDCICDCGYRGCGDNRNIYEPGQTSTVITYETIDPAI